MSGTSAKAWVFQVHAEVSLLPGSEMALEYSGRQVAGAFVNVYVPADSLEESIDRAKAVLAENRYGVVGLDWAMKIELDEWESEEREPSLSEIEELLNGDDYLFGAFYVYGSDDAH